MKNFHEEDCFAVKNKNLQVATYARVSSTQNKYQMETREELEKKLKWLFDEEQQLGINEQDRFHNSEEGRKQYEALFENHPSCKDVKSEETIEELTAKLERYKRGDFS